MLMLLSSGTGDHTSGTTGFKDGAEPGRPIRKLWWLQAKQDQSLKQGRAIRDRPGGPEGRMHS